MKQKLELKEKELIELGEFTSNLTTNKLDNNYVGKRILDKINEIKSRIKEVVLPYLKESLVKNKTKEDIDKISEKAVLNLLTNVLKVHLKRKPTEDDFKKIHISHEVGKGNQRFVYFPEGKYLGEYSNIKEGGYFKLVFRFKEFQ